VHGQSAMIVSDNGTELTSNGALRWVQDCGGADVARRPVIDLAFPVVPLTLVSGVVLSVNSSALGDGVRD
jgi:hypothetical protein